MLIRGYMGLCRNIKGHSYRGAKGCTGCMWLYGDIRGCEGFQRLYRDVKGSLL